MRKRMNLFLAGALAISATGCLIFVSGRDLDDDIEVVEIDGEYYVKDKDSHRIKKVEVQTSTTTETTTTEKPKQSGGS